MIDSSALLADAGHNAIDVLSLVCHGRGYQATVSKIYLWFKAHHYFSLHIKCPAAVWRGRSDRLAGLRETF